MGNFTPAQQQAIDCDDTNILVSAAAGSGKTAVLTERILRHISQGIDIDRLLIVTFTEAASAEMRERVAKKLHDAGLTEQVMRLRLANISTIHSFCRKLVQEHFQLVDIDPAFRVGDEAELSLIRTQVMDELFEEEYASENNQQFLDLADVYGGKTMDGRLDLLVRKIHDFMESDPFPRVAAQRYADYFDLEMLDLDATPWANVVRDELALGLEGALEGLNQAIAICGKPGGPYKYVEKLLDEKELFEDLQAMVLDKKCVESMYEAFTRIDWGRLPTITAKDNVDPDLKVRVQEIRDGAVKKRINNLVKGVFFAPPGKMQADLSALAPRVSALMELAVKFSAAFATEKRLRNLLDFTDLEHFAIQILYPDGPDDLTPFSAYKFHEVLIDEYQDSNAVQDLILSAVAERRFMVGDVKQSIYRFRRANPGLFLAKYKAYDETPKLGTRIDLSHNFRSRPEVLHAVNFFFSQLMCQRVGEVEYDDHAALHAGHEKYPDLPTGSCNKMWVELLDQSDEHDTDIENMDNEEDIPDNVVAETRILAKCILELLNESSPRKVWDSDMGDFRPCRPGDIAVLTRGLSSMAGTIIEELNKYGIDAVADMDTGFLEQQEIKVALAFLRVTDNPRQDIDLITVLRSPVYGVTEDELLAIKQVPSSQPNPLFYDHLPAFVKLQWNQNPLFPKVQKFLDDLENWRKAALHLPISRLIGLIYDMSQYPSHVLAMPDGELRQANLRLLFERAIEFEETSLKGLFHFINYIERLYDSNVRTGGAIAEPTHNPDGRVRIMTIHKSKGLEFPVVICAFLGKMFNTEDARQPVILHSDLGVGPYYVDTGKRTRSNTLARFSLARLSARESLSEELRCLYVALTRAKELLILTARVKNLHKSVQNWSNHVGTTGVNLPAYYRSGVKSYLDWLMPCLLRHHSAEELIGSPSPGALFNHPANFRLRTHRQADIITNVAENVISFESKPCNSLNNSIKHATLKPLQPALPLPSKLAISEIKRLYDITQDSTLTTDMPPSFDPPAFMQSQTNPSPAQIGQIMHIVTEHLDFSLHIDSQAVEVLIRDLIVKNLISDEEAVYINREKILTLTNSPLAARIRQSLKVYRETPFILALPASELYPDNPAAQDETVLVHGIIDCYFEEDGEIVLVDYKSDAQPTRHITQMEIYKKAITNATALNVKEVLIYSFALGEAVNALTSAEL